MAFKDLFTKKIEERTGMDLVTNSLTDALSKQALGVGNTRANTNMVVTQISSDKSLVNAINELKKNAANVDRDAVAAVVTKINSIVTSSGAANDNVAFKRDFESALLNGLGIKQNDLAGRVYKKVEGQG